LQLDGKEYCDYLAMRLNAVNAPWNGHSDVLHLSFDKGS
jgi:hypothetical protein